MAFNYMLGSVFSDHLHATTFPIHISEWYITRASPLFKRGCKHRLSFNHQILLPLSTRSNRSEKRKETLPPLITTIITTFIIHHPSSPASLKSTQSSTQAAEKATAYPLPQHPQNPQSESWLQPPPSSSQALEVAPG